MPPAGVAPVWLLIGDKSGDNAQIEIIAEALGLPVEVRRVLPRLEFVLGKPRFEASLDHLDPESSDRLEPPWPALILTVGRRAVMAALWVQAQSGGRSKIVLLGRPKRWQERFALIIAPSQYRLPDGPNVQHLELPLMRSNEAAVARAADAWRERFAGLARPVTALLVGGQTKPFRFDADVARELLESARRAAGDGCLYISTSRRTPPAVVDFLQKNLPRNARLYCWSAASADNPYRALLGLADRFIVTGDSISMMIEVARLGKPLAIYALPYRKSVGPKFKQSLMRSGLAGILFKSGLMGYSRDLTAVHKQLYDKQLAAPLGEGFSCGGKKPDDELPCVVARIKRLLQ